MGARTDCMAIRKALAAREITSVTRSSGRDTASETPSLTEQITGRLSRLFSREQEPSGPPAAVRLPAAARRDTLSARGFSAALRRHFTDHESISAGGLQIIGMGRIRERLGDRWERYAARVHGTAVRVLQQRLAATDVFSRHGDFGYIVLFAELAEEQAQIKCSLIAEEIARDVLGEDEATEGVEVQTVVTRVDGSIVAERVDLLDAVDRLLQKQFQAPGAAPDRMLVGSQSRLARVRSPEPVGAHPHRHWQDEPWPERPWPERPCSELRFGYRPVWHVYRQALLTVNCLPRRARHAGVVEVGHDVLGLDPTHREIAELDLLMLRRTIGDLQSLAAKGRLPLLAVQVHIKTLIGAKSSRDYVMLCQTIPNRLRGHLVFEITGLSMDVPQASVAKAIPLVLPFCRIAIGEVPMGQVRLDDLCGSGLVTIGINVGRRRHSEARLFEDMERFAGAASAAGFGAFVHGLHSKSLATAAVCSGFRYLDGDGIRPAGASPDCVTHFKTPDLFHPLFFRQRRPGGDPCTAASAP